MPLGLASRGIAYITAAMSQATPPSYPYYLYFLTENVCVPFNPDGNPFENKTFHYYCRLGELTSSQYNRLEKWLGQFQKEDKYVVDHTKVFNKGEVAIACIGAFIEFKVAQITEQTSDELKQLIASGHDDFQRALAAGRERVLEDDHSPYRVLYEIYRKAAFFGGRETDDAESCRTTVADGNSKLSNNSSPSPVSTVITPPSRKKRGRPQSQRNAWIMSLHNEGKKPAEIRDIWNALQQSERAQIDPSDPAIYSNRSRAPDGRSYDLESIRHTIKRARKRCQFQKES